LGQEGPLSVGRAASALDRRDLVAVVGFLLFVLLFFSQVLLLPGEVCLGRPQGDGRNQFYGWRAYGFGEVRAGRFPLWNPYEFLGMPFVASLQSALFYPTNWLCAVLPLGRAINLGIVVNLFLSGLFTYLWCRRLGLRWPGGLAAAGIYAFAAPQVLRIFEGHWSFLCPMPWIPCVLLCTEVVLTGRRLVGVGGGAAAVAMQMFGGNPQYAFYGGIAAVMYLAVRAWQERGQGAVRLAGSAACFAAMYGLGALLAGVQLVPALELLLRSARRGQLSYSWVAQYSLVPESLVTLLVPDFFGSDVGAQYWGRWNLWEMSPYLGVVTLVLVVFACFSRRRGLVRLGFGIAAALFVLALGGYTPLLRVLYRVVPGFDLFRAQARFLSPFSLFAALLAGLGLDGLCAAGRKERPEAGLGPGGVRMAAWGIGGVALALGAGGVLLNPCWDLALSLWARFMRRVIRMGLPERLYLLKQQVTADFVTDAMQDAGLSLIRSGLLLGAVAILLVLYLRMGRRPGLLAAGMLALLAVDMWGFGQRYLKTFDPRRDGLSPGAVAFLRGVGEPLRFARGGCYTLPPCEGMTHRLACLEGVQPNAPARFRDVFWSIQGRDRRTQLTSYSVFNLSGAYRAFRMLNLRYLVQYRSNPRTPMPGLRTAYEDDRIRIDELPDPWPRAWLVHEYRVVPDDGEMLRLLARFDYENIALLEQDPGLHLSPPSLPEAPPRFLSYEPNRIRLMVTARADGLLVLSDLYYPGWIARVDGRPVEILRANYLMRAVHVPAGEHEVIFLYAPLSFAAGVWMSVAGGLAAAGLGVGGAVRRRGRG